MSKFKFELRDNVMHTSKEFTIVGRAQYVEYSYNMYLLIPYNEPFDLDFTKGHWKEEDKLTLLL